MTTSKKWPYQERFSIIDPTSDSPLWMVTTEPVLNKLVMQLQRLRYELSEDSSVHRELQFSRAHLAAAREAFSNMIRKGEKDLHRLCQLLADTFLEGYYMESVVIGEIESTRQRFTITQGLTQTELDNSIDIDLGTHQLSKLRFKDGDYWSEANLIANVVEYQPSEPNPYAIHRLVSRIKAEEEIWNKVVDEIFDLDRLVKRDKQLRHLSRYVKDVFGIKIVVGEVSDMHRMQSALGEWLWSDEAIRALNLEPQENMKRLEFVEVKNYLTERKSSGWEAIKSVVRWSDKTFEIQVQSLRNFLRERERLTRESHLSFRANRERVRLQVAQQTPLFGFYRELLRWLFLNSDQPPPEHRRVTLRLVE